MTCSDNGCCKHMRRQSLADLFRNEWFQALPAPRGSYATPASLAAWISRLTPEREQTIAVL